MKKIKIVLVLFIALSTFNTIQAQTSTKKKAKETIIVTDKHKKVVTHNSITYYIFDGMWHTKLKNKYVLRTAPKGAITNFLPTGGEQIKIAGKKYYKCKGVFYKTLGNNRYQVAKP